MLKSTIGFWCTSLCAMTLCNAQEVSENVSSEMLSQTPAKDSGDSEFKAENVSSEMPPPSPPQKECGHSEQHMRASVRYTTPKGIGYNDGYTTIEGFFSTNPCRHDSWLPFLDLRGHVFDNGKLAANAGLGLRYLGQTRVWGMNAYYDYRNTNRQHYNQVAAGLECLGRVWDFRINGYLPVGWKQSPHFHTEFYAFSGNSLLIKYKKDFAMKGANAEAGFHVDSFKQAPLYFAAGSYYLTGRGKTTWGGELRATAEFFHRYLKLEGNTSYDHFFKWIGQGQVSVNIPLGKRCKIAEKETCAEDRLFARAIQRIDRNEIIPVGRQKIVTPATDPATGQPWVFWFVDNTSHSLGTYEDPFPTLLGAQNASSANQAIYVFPGDGTTNGMSNGIILKDSQLFLGASVAHPIPTTKGTVIIPAMATSLPNIANTAGNVVTLRSNNTVSGFSITTTVDKSSGLFGNGISNLIAENNTFVTSSSLTTNGIALSNSSGQILVQNSVFKGFTCNDGSNDGNGIHVAGGALDILGVIGSSFTNIRDPSFGNGGNASFNNGTIATFVFSGNIFSGNSEAYGIENLGMITNLIASGNTFIDISQNSVGIANDTSGALIGKITTLIASGNTFSNLSLCDGILNLGEMTTLIASGNTFSNLATSTGIINFGTITTFSSMGDTFNDISGSGCITNNNTITTFSSSGNTFSGLSLSDGIFTNHPITTFSSTGDTFSGLSSSRAIAYSLPFGSPDVSVDISNDTFIAGTAPANGFATFINVIGGTLCLNFTGNMATLTTAPTYAYVFTNSGGTFNSTSDSTQSANTGSFSIGSGISFPGTCSVSP